MTIQQSLKQLRNTFNFKRNAFSKEDLKAFNTVLKALEVAKDETVNNNRLFAKLYIERLAKDIVFYKHNYILAQKNLESLLQIPLERYYFRFSQEMKSHRVKVLMDKLGIDNPISWMNEKDQDNAKKCIEVNQEEIKKVMEDDFWDQEKTTERLNLLITEILVKYSQNK